MESLKKYIRAVRFGLSYAFRFAFWPTVFLLFVVVLRAVFGYASSYTLGRLIDAIIGIAKNASASYYNIWELLFLYVLFTSILPYIFGNTQYYLRRLVYTIFGTELDVLILKKRESIDIATYEDPNFQDLIQRAFRNGLNPIYMVSTGQLEVIYGIAGLVIGSFLAIKFSPLIFVIVIASAIPSFIVDVKFASRGWTIWAKDSPEQRRYADLRGHIVGRMSLTETKLLQAGEKIMHWIRDILENFYSKQIKLEKRRWVETTVTDIISALGLMLAIYLLLKQVVNGALAVGTLVYLINVFSKLRSSISDLLTTISGQLEDSLIVNDIIHVMNTKPIITDSQEPKKLNLTSAPEIIFENVGFKYPSASKWSLKNLNITFPADHNVGLVGNNGVGKTTLVKLLCRVYDPTEGRILINGIDLKDLSREEWWSYMAVMLQDYASYDFLVKEAIGIGRPNKPINLTKVIEAAHTSQAHDFIQDWEHTYDEQLGVEFKGKEPSKGQRQKLSIAKILYRDGYVMILDEPTASVDAESEAKIFDSIENLPKDRTAILISHDFSTISQCDKIFVLDQGTLKEEGTHKELMKMKGLYSELYNLQAKRFKK